MVGILMLLIFKIFILWIKNVIGEYVWGYWIIGWLGCWVVYVRVKRGGEYFW